MKLFKLLLAAVGATVLLGALVSTASARSIETSSQTLRATFARVDFRGGFGTTECDVTLEGSLHSRTIAKVVGSLIGFITAARVAPRCRRGSATILQESLPWHVRYAGFEGPLPNITRINTNVTGARFQIREPTFGITCLAEGGTATGNYTVSGGTLTTAAIGGTSPTNCGATGTLAGTSNSLTVLNSSTAITVRLI